MVENFLVLFYEVSSLFNLRIHEPKVRKERAYVIDRKKGVVTISSCSCD